MALKVGDEAPDFDLASTIGDKDGINERATFLVDRQGKVRYAHVNEIGKERDNTGLMSALLALR